MAVSSLRAGLLGIVLVTLVGCGESRLRTAVVKGEVTYKGKPVPNGTVLFIPDAGPTATGEIQPNGTYSLTTYQKGDGAVLGKHKVLVVAMEDYAGKLPEHKSPTPPAIVPNKYTSIATSELTADVEDKENTIDFRLVDDPK